MRAEGTTDLARRKLDHHGGGAIRRHGTDHGATFVANYVGLATAHLDDETPTTIRAGGFVGDDRKTFFVIADHRPDYYLPLGRRDPGRAR
jgi:hypothetical protein